MATGRWTGEVDVWDFSGGERLHTFDRGEGGVAQEIRFAVRGRLLLVRTRRTIRQLSLDDGSKRLFTDDTGAISSFALTPPGDRILIGDETGTLRLRDLSEGRILGTLRAHGGGEFRHRPSVVPAYRGGRGQPSTQPWLLLSSTSRLRSDVICSPVSEGAALSMSSVTSVVYSAPVSTSHVGSSSVWNPVAGACSDGVTWGLPCADEDAWGRLACDSVMVVGASSASSTDEAFGPRSPSSTSNLTHVPDRIKDSGTSRSLACRKRSSPPCSGAMNP